MASPSGGRFLPGLVVLFVGSGCAALIYEIVWLQLLQLVIGLTAVSLGLLLGTFMGGMCLGSLLLPRLVAPHRHPLRVYAFLELGIGLIGLAVLFGLPWLAQLYTAKGGSGLSGMVLRGAVAAVCLLPPTLLMGATLPAMARWVEATPAGVSWLGFFYGGNIAGAVFGCLFAGFYLLRVSNMATATYVAASLNGVLALAALLLSAVSTHRPKVPTAETEAPITLPGRRIVLVAIGLSGFAALGAEVVWTRLLSLMLGATVYTFSIILAVFLLGLGLGSSLGALLARSVARPRVALGGCQAMLAVATAWTAFAITHSLPYWPVNPALALSPWFTFQLDLARCLWAILPAAILWGASFPLALAAVASGRQDAGRVVGGVYAANTVGAILGALGFSLVLVPRVGTQVCQELLVAVPAVAALLLWGPRAGWLRPDAGAANEPAQRAGGIGATVRIVGLAGATALLVMSVSPVPWGVMAYGRYMATFTNRLAPGIVAEKDVPSGGGGPPDIFCTYVGEGLNGSVAVTKWTSGVRNFHSAGKVQASTDHRDMRLQRLLGHLSALAHPKPESVLVVACGAGVTAGSFVTHPEVKRIVICDIEPLVPQVVTPMFELENHAVLKDPRTQVVLDDGRHFIRTTKEKFDIITSDPIDPWVKGCAALNTVDYYEMCKQHLNPGGIVSLWIPLYESNPDTIKSVLATFFQVFPDGILWSNDTDGEGYDAVLFGQVGPTKINLDAWQARLNRSDHARVKQSLAQVGFNTAVDVAATYAVQAGDLRDWLRDAQINTDSNLRLQYLAGMWLNSYHGRELLTEIRQFYRFPTNLFSGSNQRLQMLKFELESPQSQP